jgi:hypothetical protein
MQSETVTLCVPLFDPQESMLAVGNRRGHKLAGMAHLSRTALIAVSTSDTSRVMSSPVSMRFFKMLVSLPN